MKTITASFLKVTEIDTIVNENSLHDDAQLLIQVFSGTTKNTSIEKTQEYFRDNFPKATLIGSTTDGVIEKKSVYNVEKSVLIFSYFESTRLKSTLLNHNENLQDYYQSGYMVASTLISIDTKLIITFADGINTNGEVYLNGISAFDSNVVIAGGMAGDNGALVETYVFDKNKITSNGAVAVALDSDCLEVTTDYSFDWTPIGKNLSVTKAQENRVYEIDGMSAVDLYAKYLGKELASQLPQIGIEYPLIVDRDGIDTARAVIGRNEDGSLVFAGNIREGEYVRFGIGDIDSILRYTDSNTKNILESATHKIETFFIYSCMARRRFMGHYIEKELDSYADIAVSAGFFTYGEFFHKAKNNKLLNETMTVLALSESRENNTTPMKQEVVLENSFGINSLHTVTHLLNVTAKELEELNHSLVTRVEMSTDMLLSQAYQDKLTKLPNRSKLLLALPSSIGKTILLINIDKFTIINDFYGHNFGDIVLKRIATVVDGFSKSKDALAFKLPSDEFAIILDRGYGKTELEDVIQKLLYLCKNTLIQNNNIDIKIDITVSSSRLGDDELGFTNANMAMKLAKERRLEFLIFDEDLLLHKNYELNLNIAQNIREAIDENNIISYYQPIYKTGTETIEKYECLVRLRKNNGEVLSPFAFLDVAQKIKLYPKITEMMVENTFSYFANTDYNFTINLAFEDIFRKSTNAFILDKIKKYGIGEQLTIEILETQEIGDQKIVEKFIDYVSSLGVKIAIDDFGSGFANFHRLAHMKAEYIKIDGSLIKEIDTDVNSRIVVETIVGFAKRLGMQTVAEYVHSKEVYDVVCELGIDFSQGYYLDMPLENI